MIARCAMCRGVVWPWQRFGWRVRDDGSRVTWHSRPSDHRRLARRTY